MNFRSFIRGFAAAFLTALAFVGAPAMAQCISGCDVLQGTTTTPTQSPTTSTLNFNGTGHAGFNGFGAALFEGHEGYALVEKVGSSKAELVLNAAGNLCGVNCPDGSFSFKGTASEAVNAAAGARTLQSGQQATAVNAGMAQTSAGFSVQKLTGN
jgi:hypothetical protein